MIHKELQKFKELKDKVLEDSTPGGVAFSFNNLIREFGYDRVKSYEYILNDISSEMFEEGAILKNIIVIFAKRDQRDIMLVFRVRTTEDKKPTKDQLKNMWMESCHILYSTDRYQE
jgi:hypothetical protein